jgi:hypothetical protein
MSFNPYIDLSSVKFIHLSISQSLHIYIYTYIYIIYMEKYIHLPISILPAPPSTIPPNYNVSMSPLLCPYLQLTMYACHHVSINTYIHMPIIPYTQLSISPQLHLSIFCVSRIIRDWVTYVCYNEEHSNNHGKRNDWSAKFIGGPGDHLKCMWRFQNDIYHQNNKGNIAHYKLEALDRDMEQIGARHTELLPKLHDFQKQHFDRRQRITDLIYESKKCWTSLAMIAMLATLAKLATICLHDAETNILGLSSDMDRILGWRTGVGQPDHGPALLSGHCG